MTLTLLLRPHGSNSTPNPNAHKPGHLISVDVGTISRTGPGHLTSTDPGRLS